MNTQTIERLARDSAHGSAVRLALNTLATCERIALNAAGGNSECRAKDPSKCPYHGGKGKGYDPSVDDRDYTRNQIFYAHEADRKNLEDRNDEIETLVVRARGLKGAELDKMRNEISSKARALSRDIKKSQDKVGKFRTAGFKLQDIRPGDTFSSRRDVDGTMRNLPGYGALYKNTNGFTIEVGDRIYSFTKDGSGRFRLD